MLKGGAKLWAVMPAAGQGRRVGGNIPKQYREIAGVPVLTHSLNKLAAVPQIDAIIVGIAETDGHWQKLVRPHAKPVTRYFGGQSRAETVWFGLQALQEFASEDDWVLVHDAARPCVDVGDIHTLISEVVPSYSGGLLAVPMTDTIKIANKDLTAAQTMDRTKLWRAQTPQLFQYSVLCSAMKAVSHDFESISDESAAVEKLGLDPLLVQATHRNIKITSSEDLLLAELFLSMQS